MKDIPAFPTKINTEHFSHPSTIYNTGMQLRDYFAAKAMQSINSREDYNDVPADFIAQDAYELADAMLKAREQK